MATSRRRRDPGCRGAPTRRWRHRLPRRARRRPRCGDPVGSPASVRSGGSSPRRHDPAGSAASVGRRLSAAVRRIWIR